MIKFTCISLLVALTAASAYVIDAKSPHIAPSRVDTVVSQWVYATGIVEGATREVQLRPEVPGRVVEVLKTADDFVQAGDLLLRLDDRREKQLVAESIASLELARAQLERLLHGSRPSEIAEARAICDARRARLNQAIKSWNRVEHLHRQAAVSQQEADEKQGLVDALTAELSAVEARLAQLEAPARDEDIRAARARVAAAEAQCELAKLALEKCVVKAPSQGRILDVQVEPGEIIGPDSVVSPFVLTDTTHFRVRAYVEEVDAPRVRVGVRARITADGLPQEYFEGVVTSLSPRMTPKQISSNQPNELYDTKMREILIDVTEPDLLIGLRVDVMLAIGDAAAAAGQYGGPPGL